MAPCTSWSALAVAAICACPQVYTLTPSSFHGSMLVVRSTVPSIPRKSSGAAASLTMRKQKASDRRTRRMQRGQVDGSNDTFQPLVERIPSFPPVPTMSNSPMASATWKHKSVARPVRKEKGVGRGRARKRSALYNSLASYQNKFLDLLTAEYQAEVRVIASDVAFSFSV